MCQLIQINDGLDINFIQIMDAGHLPFKFAPLYIGLWYGLHTFAPARDAKHFITCGGS